MSTTKQVIQGSLNLYVTPNYPTIAQGNIPLSDYIDIDTLVIDPPSVFDPVLLAIIQDIVAVRNADQFNYNTTVSAAELKDIYTDIVRDLTAKKTAIDTVLTPVAAYLATLP